MLAPILEVFTEDGYFWVGWDDVQSPRRRAASKPARHPLVPSTPGDGFFSGKIGFVIVPGLYPNTASQPDDAVKLGMSQVWEDVGAGADSGRGLENLLGGRQVEDPDRVERPSVRPGPSGGVDGRDRPPASVRP